MAVISYSTHQPLYHQLKQIIISEIQNGEYKENDKLPTESELCHKYGISKAPIRQALNELANENYIYKIRGKGSFVLSGYIKQKAGRLRSFTEEIREQGHRPGAKLVEHTVEKADAETAKNLNIDMGDEVLSVVRLRYIDDEAYSLNYSYLPVKRFPKLAEVDYSVLSILPAIEEKLGCEMDFATVVVEATATTPEISKLLERKVGTPLLMTNRTTYIRLNNTGVPVEFLHGYFVPGKYKFEVQLSK